MKCFRSHRAKPALRSFGLLLFGVFSIGVPLDVQADELICTFIDESGVIRQVRGKDSVPQSYISVAKCQKSRAKKAPRPHNTSANTKLKKFNTVCMYQDEQGGIHQVPGPGSVPQQYQASVRCMKIVNKKHIADPDEVELDGSLRKERMISPLGGIQLRWPRSVERLFGRTPKRAVVDAANAVHRAVKMSAFPTHLQRWEEEWDIVFMDADVPETQIPRALVDNCHPGWMLAPAKVYIVGQRVAAGCGGKASSSSSVADSQLAEVLIHEMGHAVDYALRPNNFSRSRQLAEGFATWFTAYASDFSSEISGGSVRRKQFAAARASLAQSTENWTFRGSGEDYARASLYFHALVERKGVRGLVRVYDYMNTHNVDFFTAADKAVYWDQSRFQKEIVRLLK